MRTPTEQAEGLAVVAEKASALQPINLALVPSDGSDVAVLRGRGHGTIEVVYAAGGYDVWAVSPQSLVATNLTADEAARWLADDYKTEKLR